jgi:hypothetical protein
VRALVTSVTSRTTAASTSSVSERSGSRWVPQSDAAAHLDDHVAVGGLGVPGSGQGRRSGQLAGAQD